MARKIPRIPIIYDEEELKKIIDAIEKNPCYCRNFLGEFTRLRDSTAIKTYFYSGSRPGEILKLRWQDLDFDNNLIYIDPFWNKQRCAIPMELCSVLKDILIDYAKKLAELQFIKCEYLFPSIATRLPMTTDAFGKRLLKLKKDAGLAKVIYYTADGKPVYDASLYSFRKSFMTNVYIKTGSEVKAAEAGRIGIKSIGPYVHLNHKQKQDFMNQVFENAQLKNKEAIKCD